VRAGSEHPRIATTVASALIVLALAGVGAGRALGGAQPIHNNDKAVRIADTQLAQLRQQLQTSQAQSAQLRGQLATLTAQLAHARQSQQRAATGTRIKRRRPKR
jgi:uncharacterized protein HemX